MFNCDSAIIVSHQSIIKETNTIHMKQVIRANGSGGSGKGLVLCGTQVGVAIPDHFIGPVNPRFLELYILGILV